MLKAKGIWNMKTLRYLLIVIGVLSVVSVAAATFGTTYQPQRRGIQYTRHYAEMPTLAMGSTGSVMMKSGSALPIAAVSGTTTADDYAPSGPRRAKKEDPDPSNPFYNETTGENENIGGTGNPNEPGTPIGDAILPLMVMALAFCGVVYLRRKKRTLNG